MHSLLPRAALLVLATVLAAGLWQISRLALSGGTGYAEYSSQRSDPEGTKIFFDALQQTGRVSVSRNYRDLLELQNHDATVFLLGLSPVSLLYEDNAGLENFERIANGNRLVIALHSAGALGMPKTPSNSALEKRWGVVLESNNSALRIAKSKGWSTFEVGIARRAFGSGEILLVADTSIFTNQAMVADRQTALITEVVGTRPNVIFDESHLGMTDQGTVLGLARKYRLQGLIAGLALLAVAFIWRSAIEFPPVRQTAEERAEEVAGKDAGSGFIRLLERHVPPGLLLATCAREWQKSAGPAAVVLTASAASDPVAEYARLQQQAGPKVLSL